MKKGIFVSTVCLLAVWMMPHSISAAPIKTLPAKVTISTEKLMDKIKGGWAGQTIGCTFGGPTEFKYPGSMIQDYVPIVWPDGYIKYWYENIPGLYDDVYMDLTFVDVFDRLGLDAPVDSFAMAFAHVLEQRVSVELQMEYFKYSQQLRKTATIMSDADFDSYIESLSDPTLELAKKKSALSSLAISRQVKAYRFLEDYVHKADDDVRDWAAMALMECRISLESELSDERQVYISTGLGGKGEKLRFFILMIANELKDFADYQKEMIEREFPFALNEAGCDIERLTIKEKYAELLILMPMRRDVKSIFDRVISECNQYGNFLSTVYTITNVKELSEEEIDLVIKKYEKNLQTGS